ncbi:hypothetical protein Agub_g14943, partial [Astrephomene gubernaculifera]
LADINQELAELGLTEADRAQVREYNWAVEQAEQAYQAAMAPVGLTRPSRGSAVAVSTWQEAHQRANSNRNAKRRQARETHRRGYELLSRYQSWEQLRNQGTALQEELAALPGPSNAAAGAAPAHIHNAEAEAPEEIDNEGGGSCEACVRRTSVGDLRCETCDIRAHRRCLGLPPGSYPGGWFRCIHCILAAAGFPAGAAGGRQEALAARLVALAGSAVSAGSAGTYESHRRRYAAFCAALGLPMRAAFPPARGADLSPELVSLFIAHEADRVAPSTLSGTISALADW